ncbi:hypothetical protein [Chitinophaga silvatica]|nr:hypothetical protein [Chitinophaga silvatica]
MKSQKKTDKLSKYKPEDLASSIVFPGPENENESRLELVSQYRKEWESKRTPKDRLISQLLQLKFQIEEVIRSDKYDKEKHFGYFLKEYISCLEKKNKEFAEEVDVDPTELSLFINRRRDPPEKFIIRLEIHSNKNFPAIMWYKLIEKEKEYKLMYNNDIRASEYGHVKGKLRISI